jgi:hypothetical protein
MAYIKPPANNLPFRFTSNGYIGPNAGGINYRFRASATANLQAAINVLSEDYIKECPTYTVAYGGKIQVIQLPCVYSGYRHLNAYIYGNPEHADLGAYILAVSGQGDLGAYIKGIITTYTDLPASLYGVPPADLSAQIHGWDTRNLGAVLTGELFKSTADLQAVLNVIEISDLPAIINGELHKGQADLGAKVLKIFSVGYKNLGAYISSKMVLTDLPAELNIVSTEDLPAILKVFLIGIKNLQAYVNTIQVGNLPASIHGWATADLLATLVGGYGPNDLQAYITGTGGYKNLSAYIKGMIATEVSSDLRGIIEGWYSFDLGAAISLIYPIDLGAYIFATGKIADLPASIVPRIIHLKQAIRIALLEHLDLSAMINSSCFASGSTNLSAYVYPLMKADLRAVIFGWHVNIYSNVADLAAAINVGVLGVEDKLPISFVPQPLKYTILRVKFDTKVHRVFDTLRILFSGYYTANLPATLTGVPESTNLSAYIKAVFDWNYSELPPHVNPKTHEIVIDFDENWRENWRRFVEIFFDFTGDSPYHYFYVSGADKVYRVDRDRHWVVRAKSYQRVSGMIERRGVRRKYIFKMSDYANVDEAVRDLIDRVSTYRRADLGAYINGGLPTHLNLSASICPDVKYSWVKNLHASITATEFFDLSATITGVL